MKKQYIIPQCHIIRLESSSNVMLATSPQIDIKEGETVDDMDQVGSKSYQGGANSLLWEED